MAATAHLASTAAPRVVLGALAIVALASYIYSAALCGDFILDDDILLTRNNLVRASDGLSHIWSTTEAVDYWPVTNSSFWLEWRIWGEHPQGYRVTNLVLHVVSA